MLASEVGSFVTIPVFSRNVTGRAPKRNGSENEQSEIGKSKFLVILQSENNKIKEAKCFIGIFKSVQLFLERKSEQITECFFRLNIP